MAWLILPVFAGACSRDNPAYDAAQEIGGASEEQGSEEQGSEEQGSEEQGEPEPTVGSEEGEMAPVCGNGLIEEDEVCDDALNDGSYGSCSTDCSALAAHCGDEVVDHEFEMCDDGDEDLADGCLPNCVVPRSCLEIREFFDEAEDGVYRIDPGGNEGPPFDALCDMTTDGGGYTFYKVDQASAHAYVAEEVCGSMGMQLWIPRSEAHLASGLNVANNEFFGPSAGDMYLQIMGVYPNESGSICANEPMNSDSEACDWRAGDDQSFWVSGHDLYNEPNGNNGDTNPHGSMFYEWTDGEISWYDDVSNDGASSGRFMCDVGDKW